MMMCPMVIATKTNARFSSFSSRLSGRYLAVVVALEQRGAIRKEAVGAKESVFITMCLQWEALIVDQRGRVCLAPNSFRVTTRVKRLWPTRATINRSRGPLQQISGSGDQRLCVSLKSERVAAAVPKVSCLVLAITSSDDASSALALAQ